MSSIVNQSMLPAMGEEALPAFDTNMYPNGVNANFYNLEKLPAEQVLGKFSGIFEDKESRDIARVAPDLIKMLASFGLVEGARVVDVGCGTGLLLTQLSNAVGSTGSVVATEISEVFYNHLLKKVDSEGLSNVTCLLNDNPRNPQIDQYKGTVDLILVIDVYHHLEYPRTFMRHLKDALKPTGWRA
jgi:cyclopropane fatty-acyl-phospholipid synthase-like methyltransferase